MNLSIDKDRLASEIERMAEFSSSSAPSVTRVLFSPEDLAAREYLDSLAAEAGLSKRMDALGNTFFRWEGSDPQLPAVGTGSHLDAIPNAGKFDGVVGVLGGLEAIRALQRSGFQPKAPVELVLFTAEEPTRFGMGCLGSRVLAGTLDENSLAALRDDNGKTLEEWLTEMDWPKGTPSSARLSPGAFGAFVELHIEQGPILEAEEMEIGIVEKIAAPAAFRLRLIGEGGHAGAVLMPHRRDAGLGAAEITLAVERAVLGSGSPDGVGTTGVVRLEPGAINSIPLRAVLEIDMRDTDPEARDRAVEQLRREAEQIAQARKLKLHWETIHIDPPAHCGLEIVKAVEAACEQEKLSYRRMVSRAYHDSLFMARIAPTGMIFIPCRSGFSHRPDEFSSPEQIAKGTLVLAHTLATLSSKPENLRQPNPEPTTK